MRKNNFWNPFQMVAAVATIFVLVSLFISCAIPGKIVMEGGDFTLQVKGNMVLEISLLPIPIVLRIKGRSVFSMEGKIIGKTHADGIILQVGDTICTLMVTDVAEGGVFGTLACEAAVGAAQGMFVLRPPGNTGIHDILSWIKEIWPSLRILKRLDNNQ